ncbi:MAG: hypothetical protein KGJ89_01960 [Patescibacteria group bacterium]|nr:hypothetical protein [Patescibacteria group bacterium]MDE2015642.1 hypothetical protein [Patescibacteria group bacterium]MDE2226699.1 hypothetical protein [Patescibacteria group bacterium]
MKSRYRCLVLTLSIIVAFGTCSLALGAKKKRQVRIRRETLPQEIFRNYPDLRGSEDSLELENAVADENFLLRIPNRHWLERVIGDNYLIPVSKGNRNFYLDQESFMDRGYGDRKYLAPLALAYLEQFSETYNRKFYPNSSFPHLKITSLVRTQDYQNYLVHKKHNRSAASGDVPEHRSVHLTGYAFDVSVKKMTRSQALWSADYFGKDILSGLILGVYEARGGDFHIMVVPQ